MNSNTIALKDSSLFGLQGVIFPPSSYQVNPFQPTPIDSMLNLNQAASNFSFMALEIFKQQETFSTQRIVLYYKTTKCTEQSKNKKCMKEATTGYCFYYHSPQDGRQPPFWIITWFILLIFLPPFLKVRNAYQKSAVYIFP